tara:strand:+ start:689 stop:829 length:141 start_codon:yes stop_codon:yes gene_type:complete
VSPKQKALELHMDTIGNKRIDDNIKAALEGKERSPRKEKKKKKKPK